MPVPSTPHHQAFQLHAPVRYNTAHICITYANYLIYTTACIAARWPPRQNIRTFRNATASRKQATANRLPHTRLNLYPEMPGLRTTMFPMTSRYAYKAHIVDLNSTLTIHSSAALSQKQPSRFACNSSERSTRS
jgi:hypothetical protein